MSDESEPKANRTWLYVLGIVAGLPLLYVLSVGPMIALALRGVIPNELADYFCRPASWFAISTGTASAMNSYVVAWHNLTGTEY